MADNIKVKNIYYMLAYAYQTLREAGFEDLGAEDFDNIHDLLAAILARGVSDQVRRGLYRDYIPRQEALSALRGRICVGESIKQQTLSLGKLVCAYDEFSENSAHNRILKTTMLLLLQLGSLTFANQEALRRLLPYFSGVEEIAPISIRWERLSYDRNNASYRLLINICRIVLEGLLLTTEAGDLRLAKWLSDEQMYKLYEKFVLSYYQREHPAYSARAAYIDWDLAEGTDRTFLPVMKSDITLTKGDRILIIDTKWYSHTMATILPFDSTTFISGNLYQIFTYVKNKDRQRAGNVAGVLLYAKTDEAVTPDDEFFIGGNWIGLKTLDLSQEWSGVTSQLESLCSWLEA